MYLPSIVAGGTSLITSILKWAFGITLLWMFGNIFGGLFKGRGGKDSVSAGDASSTSNVRTGGGR